MWIPSAESRTRKPTARMVSRLAARARPVTGTPNARLSPTRVISVSTIPARVIVTDRMMDA